MKRCGLVCYSHMAFQVLALGVYTVSGWKRSFLGDATTSEQCSKVDHELGLWATFCTTHPHEAVPEMQRLNRSGLLYCVGRGDQAPDLFVAVTYDQPSATQHYELLQDLKRAWYAQEIQTEKQLGRYLIDCNTDPKERGKIKHLEQEIDETRAHLTKGIMGLLDRQQSLEELDETTGRLLLESGDIVRNSKGVADKQRCKALKWGIWCVVVLICVIIVLGGGGVLVWFLGLIPVPSVPSWNGNNNTL